MFYTYWYISRKLDSKKMTFHSQSRVYPLSFKENFRTGPGPVLSLFGLKDRRTGPFKKARTVDTLMMSTPQVSSNIIDTGNVLESVPCFARHAPVPSLPRRPPRPLEPRPAPGAPIAPLPLLALFAPLSRTARGCDWLVGCKL